MPKTRLIYFGTADFAVPPLRALLNEPELFDVLAVVSQPDRPAGRKGELKASPVSEAAREAGLPLLQPESLKDAGAREELAAFGADAFVVAAYGQIVPPEVLELPRLGCLNLHGSLLPKYRGASPIQAAILDGEEETGVTLMLMDEKLDHGPMLGTTRTEIRPDDDYPSLSARLAEAAAGLLLAGLPRFASGESEPQEQDHDAATFTRILKKDDGRVDWQAEGAERIERKVRAYRPWPGAFADIETSKGPRRVKLLSVEAVDAPGESPPGTLTGSEDGLPLLSTLEGSLMLLEVQPEGKRPMTGKEFANAYLK